MDRSASVISLLSAPAATSPNHRDSQLSTTELVPILKDLYERTRQDLEAVKASNGTNLARIGSLEDDNARLQAEVNRLHVDLRLARDALGTQRDSKGFLSELTGDNGKLQTLSIALQDERQKVVTLELEHTKSMTELRQEYETAQNQVKELKKQLKSPESNRVGVISAQESLGVVAETRETVAQMSEKIIQFKKEIQDTSKVKNAALDKSVARIGELQTGLAEAENKLSLAKDIKAKLKEAKKEIVALKEQLSQKEVAVSTSTTIAQQDAESRIATLREKYRLLKEKKNATKQELASKMSELEEMEELKRSLRLSKENFSRLEKEMKTFKAQVPPVIQRHGPQNNVLDVLPPFSCKTSGLTLSNRKSVDAMSREASTLLLCERDCIFGTVYTEHFIHLRNPFRYARYGGQWSLTKAPIHRANPGDVVNVFLHSSKGVVYRGKYELFDVEVDLQEENSFPKNLERLVNTTIVDQDVITPAVRSMMIKMYQSGLLAPLTTGYKCVGFDYDVYHKSIETPVPIPGTTSVSAVPVPHSRVESHHDRRAPGPGPARGSQKRPVVESASAPAGGTRQSKRQRV